ncbi:MAG: hypothetical protein AB1749_13945 [Pseudomonadota bacterium]
MRFVTGALLHAFAVLFAGAASAETVIGGATPDRRPDGVPVIGAFALDRAARAKALSGVSKPYPASLGFLDDQGAWYTPFSHPGMTGPYDIRGLHSDKR